MESQWGRSGNDRVPGDEVIRTPDRRLRVFVSSTLGELAEERRAVSRAISALRLTPVMFEVGARAHPPQDLYRAYLAQSDVFVGLYWQQYGWVGPGMEISGLQDEFELSRALPRLLYVKGRRPTASPGSLSCWLASRTRPQCLTVTSGPRENWAGWCAMTWRCC